MNVQHINPFVCAAYNVIETLTGEEPTKGSLSVRANLTTTQQCNVVTGVTGQLEGVVIYGMTLVTADRVASAMIGQPVITFDQLAASAIAELANMVSGNAMTMLAEQGFICDITPPSIVRGSNVQITTFIKPSLVIPLSLTHGEIELTVCLRERGQ